MEISRKLRLVKDEYQGNLKKRQIISFLTVVPEALSVALERTGCDRASAVAGRVALFERFVAIVVDALVAVDGLEAR